jgi:hypothetical protein
MLGVRLECPFQTSFADVTGNRRGRRTVRSASPRYGRRENGARGFSELGADRGRCEGSRERFAVCSRHEVRGRWWQGDVWLEVLSDPRFKDWMKEQLIGWRNKY